MPLTLEEKDKIIELAKEFRVRRVWLFGSALDENSEPNDIDLAVEGLRKEEFTELYNQLFDRLPRPVDLIDMDGNNPIRHIVRDCGVVIYE